MPATQFILLVLATFQIALSAAQYLLSFALLSVILLAAHRATLCAVAKYNNKRFFYQLWLRISGFFSGIFPRVSTRPPTLPRGGQKSILIPHIRLPWFCTQQIPRKKKSVSFVTLPSDPTMDIVEYREYEIHEENDERPDRFWQQHGGNVPHVRGSGILDYIVDEAVSTTHALRQLGTYLAPHDKCCYDARYHSQPPRKLKVDDPSFRCICRGDSYDRALFARAQESWFSS